MAKRKKKDWLKSKGYLHLTSRINVRDDRSKIYKLVENPTLIANHAFFPLLKKILPERRYKIIGYDESDKPVRGHKKISDGKIKSTKKKRPINYATHIDAQIYAYYSSQILEKKFEQLLYGNPSLSSCIIAYRKLAVDGKKSNKNNIHFAKEVFDFIRNKKECIAMAFDIENFFPTLNHKRLKKAWCNILGTKSLPPDHFNIFKSITKFSYIKLDDFRVNKKSFDEKKLSEHRKKGVQAFFSDPRELREAIKEGKINIYKNQVQDKDGNLCGIPQGLAISAMLANIYLLEFDKKIFEKINQIGGLYRRYSDDIAIVCDEVNREEIENLIQTEIENLKLEISSGKTEICKFAKNENGTLNVSGMKNINGVEKEIQGIPFRYLGFEFDGKKVLIKSKNLSKFYRRMKYGVKNKAKRIDKVKEKYLIDEVPLFKRKLYRSFTASGRRSRKMTKIVSNLELNETYCEYQFEQKEVKRKYWGNFIGYAYRASKIMEEPAIWRQVRNHWKILQETIEREIMDK